MRAVLGEAIQWIRHTISSDDQIDMDVMLCPESRRDEMMREFDDERWVYAATPTSSEVMWILGGDLDDPQYNLSEVDRVSDAINHEVMHNVLHRVESREASVKYDTLIEDVIDIPIYLHHYGRGIEHIGEWIDQNAAENKS